MITYLTTLPSPVGTLTLAADGTALTGLWLEGQKYFGAGLPDTVQEKDLSVFREATRHKKYTVLGNLRVKFCISFSWNRIGIYCLQSKLMLLAISTITDRGSDNFLPVTQKRQHRLLSKDKTIYRSVAASTFF